MFQVSGRDGNLSLGCSRLRICWFRYLLSLDSIIQSIVVILQGSIYNSCTFLNKIQRFLTRVCLLWYCGRTHCFGLEWLQLDSYFLLEKLFDIHRLIGPQKWIWQQVAIIQGQKKWFPQQYLSSLASLIQSFVVMLQGSICNWCNFLNTLGA